MKTQKLRLLLTMLFALVLLIGLPVMQAQGYTLGEGTCGDDMTWVLDDTGTLTVSGAGAIWDFEHTAGENHYLPPWNSVKDFVTRIVLESGVTGVGSDAFAYCYNVEEIVLPDTVAVLGKECFSWCRALDSITIPGSVETWGSGVFFGCENLTEIILQDGLYAIGEDAFRQCYALKSVTIPGWVGEIGESAFSNCPALEEVILQEGVKSIGSHAFSFCSALKELILPDSLSTIGARAFTGCDMLTTVTVPKGVSFISGPPFLGCSSLREILVAEGNPAYCSVDGILFSKDRTLLVQYPAARQGAYVIPETVTALGDSAFFECSGLTSLTIPGSVTVIPMLACYNCENITELNLLEGTRIIEEDAFLHADGLTQVVIPASVTQIGVTAFAYSDVLSNILFAGDAPEISPNAFNEVIATGRYPGGNASWTEEKRDDYGGTLTWLPQVEHRVLDGSDLTFTGADGDTVTVHLSGRAEEILSVRVDDLPVAAEAAALAEEEAVLTLRRELLNTLTAGTHRITVWFEDGYARCEIETTSDCAHSYAETAVLQPTCTAAGFRETVCSLCGHRRREALPALGHAYSDGVCSRCGEPETLLPEGPDGVYRIGGADRIATSLGIADALKEELGVEKFGSIVVASALNFPDALAGSYLAAAKQAPILLTYDAVHDRIADYIAQNLQQGGTVYILGGRLAVSAGFEEALTERGIRFRRTAGEDRIGTSLAILNEAGVTPGRTILVCTATGFADSLSASAVGCPILLVGKTLTEEQKDYLRWAGGGKICIVGGFNAVSGEVEEELKQYSEDVVRLAGRNRHETSVLVAKMFFPDAMSAVLAYSLNFPDGLCGGPLAHAVRGPLILTVSGDRTPEAYTREKGIHRGYVLGTGELIDDASARRIFALGTGETVQGK